MVKKSKPSATELRREMKNSLKTVATRPPNWPRALIQSFCGAIRMTRLMRFNLESRMHRKYADQCRRIAKKTSWKFATGNLRVLITKPSIAGHGMNFQHCNRMILWGCPTVSRNVSGRAALLAIRTTTRSF
jgi:hypothetical protein